jgi:hypothetical protein
MTAVVGRRKRPYTRRMAPATSAAPEGASDPEEAPRHSGRLLLRMPPELHGDLAEAAERQGVSLNQLITRLLSEGVIGSRPRHQRDGDDRKLRIALAVNLALVAVLTVAAVVLVVVALQG